MAIAPLAGPASCNVGIPDNGKKGKIEKNVCQRFDSNCALRCGNQQLLCHLATALIVCVCCEVAVNQ